MKFNFRLKVIPLVALIAISLMSIDLFLLPKSKKLEVVDNGSISTTRDDIASSHESFFLITKQGNRYLVPQSLFNTILIDQEFIVHKTFLFRKNAKISWCEGEKCYIQNIGTFNSNYLSYGVLGILFLLSLLSSLNILKLTPVRNYAILGFSGGAFLFYLIF